MQMVQLKAVIMKLNYIPDLYEKRKKQSDLGICFDCYLYRLFSYNLLEILGSLSLKVTVYLLVCCSVKGEHK